jgi:uncharacterized protein (TIGR02246 family)
VNARFLIGGLALLVACQRAETPEQAQARMAAEAESVAVFLDAAGERMLAFATSEDADSMASLYAEDARMYPQGEPVVEGREAIRAKYAEWFAMGSAQFDIRRHSITANGPIAIERGAYTMTIRPDPGAPAGMTAMTDTGKYVLVWKRVNGQWLIADDIANSDQLPPGTGSN